MVPNIEHVVVVRQKEKKKQKSRPEILEKSKKNSCPASVYSVDKVQKASVASVRSYRIGRRLSDTVALSPKCSFKNLRRIDSIEIFTEISDDDETTREAVKNILGEFKFLMIFPFGSNFIES
uniref:Ribosomal protein L22 n=1 Tax=Panagrolaimus sp. JU765 TaxID=591449 RepID=A0AC34PUT1_9BILA